MLVKPELKKEEKLNLYKMIIHILKNNHKDEDLNSLKATSIQLGRIIKNTMNDSENNIKVSFKYSILNKGIPFLIDPDILNSNSYSRVSFGCNILPEQTALFVIDESGLGVRSKSFLGAEQESPAGLLIFNQNERRSKK